jgi:AraC-like DNA-binding protein
MQPAVRQAINIIHERYFEPLALNDIAAEVYVSPFHFSRIFARATGLTPGRYLTAVRLFEAKRLLLTTSLTVSDIVCTVGYSSVGTFTSRFTRLVGVAPARYRDPRAAELLVAMSPRMCRLPSRDAVGEAGRHRLSRGGGVITGRLLWPSAAIAPGAPIAPIAPTAPVHAVVGLFADALPQSAPVAFAGVPAGSDRFTITGVPAGRWHVIAVAEHGEGRSASYTLGVAGYPVTIRTDELVRLNVPMRTQRHTDPPMAVTLAFPSPLSSRRTGPIRQLPAAA